MEKPICYVMVGLPACGKSTSVNASVEMDSDVFVYSTDNYIENVASAQGKTYNEAFADTIKEATDTMNRFLADAIEDKRDVIWDQTNLGIKKRASIIARMKSAGYDVECICITKPETDEELDAWSYRLSGRPGKTIPAHILANMTENYVYPTIEEGFSRITFYNMHGALLGIDYGEE